MKIKVGDVVKIIGLETIDEADTNIKLGDKAVVNDITGGVVSVKIDGLEIYDKTDNLNEDGTYDMYEEQLEKYNEVEIITCESGDWTIIKLNGSELTSGNDNITYATYRLLEELGVEVVSTEISNEEMEELYQ